MQTSKTIFLAYLNIPFWNNDFFIVQNLKTFMCV
jgi:hypothetical protein